MYNLWFAIEDTSAVAPLKKAFAETEIQATWFPATGSGRQPFPNLRYALQNSGADLLYYDSYHQPLPPASLLRQTPTLVVLENANLRPLTREWNRPGGSVLKRWPPAAQLKEAARLVAGFVVGSEWARQELVRQTGIEPGRVLVMPAGLDLAGWDELDRKLEIARRHQNRLPELIRVLFEGDDFEALGGKLLLEVFEQDPALAERCELHLITRKASVEAYLEKLSPAVRRHIHLHPFQSTAEIHLSSDIFALPAVSPASPARLATALAAGLPVIAGRVDGLAEPIQDGRNGLLVEPGDRESLAQALWKLVQDPARRYEMGQAGRKQLETGCSPARLNQPILALLKQLAARTRPAASAGTAAYNRPGPAARLSPSYAGS